MKRSPGRPQRRSDGPRPAVLGSGLLALDIVLSEVSGSPPRHWAGGTCGNVLIALSYLGWESQPIARLKTDAAAEQVLLDLKQWGVSDRFISLAEDGSTPVIVERITRGSGNVPTHSFSWRCPECGSQFPGFKPVLSSVAEEIAQQAGPPQVFFFDRATLGGVLLAKSCRRAGALRRVRAFRHRQPGSISPGVGNIPRREVLARAAAGIAGGRGAAKPAVAGGDPWRIGAALPQSLTDRTWRSLGRTQGFRCRSG